MYKILTLGSRVGWGYKYLVISNVLKAAAAAAADFITIYFYGAKVLLVKLLDYCSFIIHIISYSKKSLSFCSVLNSEASLVRNRCDCLSS
ncbi:hypothetical protein L6452_07258 [Arctium lappa]|uniref:Uncharacterized protein n=1 Tax=Arctium lappa TaxID=4217 RepID=A0ACB9EKJ4_ARCLA|nr:hypothetical protein L6452_07258 [Arctium lappa]